MKTRSINITIIALLISLLWGCSDWTEAEREDYFQLPEAAYYENLRAYKRSDHQVAFGWFGNWSGLGASMVGSMMGLPDSVDFVSIWGNWKNLDQPRMDDKRKAKEQKGIRAIVCFIVQSIGDQLTPEGENAEAYWGWVDGDKEAIYSAIDRYANAICDTIDKYDYDGFDIDYEPNYGHRGKLSGSDEYMLRFIETLSKRVGTKSGTGRLLVLDGEPQSIVSEAGPYLDYFIVQAYNSYGDADLDGRLKSTITNFAGILTPEEVAKKYIVTENFESYAQTGGNERYQDRAGNVMKSFAGMARWNPIIDGKLVPKGGAGLFHMEYDYPTTPREYKYLREAISIMNPSYKPLL